MLQYFIRDTTGSAPVTIATQRSGFFEVKVGASPYKLAFVDYPGTATGGVPFNPQPLIAVVDRGSNIIRTWNEGYVTAAIGISPDGAVLMPPSGLTVPIAKGLATFLSLYIDLAGFPYTLTFTTNLVRVQCAVDV